MRHPGWRGSGVAAICAMAFCAAFAGPAPADESGEYPSEPGARTFSGGASGWVGTSSFDGACIPPLLCPSTNSEYVAAGGADGDGHITSEYVGVAGISAVVGTTTAVWESPGVHLSQPPVRNPKRLASR